MLTYTAFNLLFLSPIYHNILDRYLGISVTLYEYTFAYVLPYVGGGYIINPSLLITLNIDNILKDI